MSTVTRDFTKEQLIEKLQHRIAVAAKYPDLDEAQLDATIFKIALASLEAEAVAYADPQAFRNFQAEAARREWMWRNPGEDLIPVYVAPPAPVVDADDNFYSWFGREWHEHYQQNQYTTAAKQMLGVMAESAWKAGRRAAMLQGADGNSPVIPDGSEDTKRLDWLDAQNKRLNEYYGTSYGWKFDANFQRNAMMLNDSNYPVMSVRQAIDEAIAAAPQQEVKSE